MTGGARDNVWLFNENALQHTKNLFCKGGGRGEGGGWCGDCAGSATPHLDFGTCAPAHFGIVASNSKQVHWKSLEVDLNACTRVNAKPEQ